MTAESTSPWARKPSRFRDLWVAIPALFLSLVVLRDLEHLLFRGEVTVDLDITETHPTVRLGSQSLDLTGSTPVTVATADLAASTLVMLAGAFAIGLVGLTVGGVLAVRALARIAEGQAFTDATIRGLLRLSVVALATFIPHQVMLHLGTNMVTRDLEITDSAFSGVWGLQFVFIMCLIGALGVVTEAFRQGKRAQDDLEGLV